MFSNDVNNFDTMNKLVLAKRTARLFRELWKLPYGTKDYK